MRCCIQTNSIVPTLPIKFDRTTSINRACCLEFCALSLIFDALSRIFHFVHSLLSLSAKVETFLLRIDGVFDGDYGGAILLNHEELCQSLKLETENLVYDYDNE